MITVNLREVGMNRGLFGDRRLREDEDADPQRAYGAGADSVAGRSREDLIAEIGDHLTLGNHKQAADLHRELRAMDGDESAYDAFDVDEPPEGKEGKKDRSLGLKSGVGGGGEKPKPRSVSSTEARKWASRLLGEVPLTESRWVRRLLA